jgi:hypothetical protein
LPTSKHIKKWDKDHKLLETSGTAGYQDTHHVPQAPVTTTTHAQTELAQMRQQIQALTSALASNNPFLAASNSSSTITPSTLAPVGLSYCWAHGSNHNRSHTSPTCHQDSATETNKQTKQGCSEHFSMTQ